jgi:predicted Fe-Mo cluster-binding NifX family protein
MSPAYWIAVTHQNRREITSHAGRCRRFRAYGIGEGRIVEQRDWEIPKEATLHENHGQGVPEAFAGIRVLISAGMGPGLVRRLAAAGIEAYVTDTTDPDTAVAKYLEGTLSTRPPGCAEDDPDGATPAPRQGADHDPGHGHGGCGHAH